MHIFLKVGLVFLVLAIVTVVITVPLVLHLRPKANETLSSNETRITTVSIKQSSTSTVSTTTTKRNDDSTSTLTSTIINVPSTTTISIIEDTITPSTTMNVEIDTSTTHIPLTLRSEYSTSLSEPTQTYCRQDPCPDSVYYFQAIKIRVATGGIYTIFSGSNMNTYGYIYHNSFIPVNPTVNLIAGNDDDAGDGQFMLQMMLHAMEKYILVVTTYDASVTGESFIIAIGPELVNFIPIYITNENKMIEKTMYSSALTYDSQMFPHGSGPNINCYYEVIEIYVPISGIFLFMCLGDMDTVGYLYNDSFNPDDRNYNLLKSDDNGGGIGRFMFEITLKSMTKYILIVTTHYPNVIGVFSILGQGEETVTFESV